jgi:GT2 family glycosyltransferase
MYLSIVLGTWNRLKYLQHCLETIASWCSPLEHEVIVVDGGSTDGTISYLEKQPENIHPIFQGELLGAVKAFNAGFALATGDYVANLNDDACLRDAGYVIACQVLDRAQHIAQVAIPFGRLTGEGGKLDYTLPLAGKRWLYANFGVTRREVGEQVGWWGTEYHTYGGDAELSMKIWNRGMQILPLHGYLIQHDEIQDELRHPNWDSDLFYQKWRKWNGPGDMRPGYA